MEREWDGRSFSKDGFKIVDHPEWRTEEYCVVTNFIIRCNELSRTCITNVTTGDTCSNWSIVNDTNGTRRRSCCICKSKIANIHSVASGVTS